ncbi:MAG: hypothetical protein K2M96_09165 [Prevotella sp.]|nr:hypothetical protein [Prevotella sp.]
MGRICLILLSILLAGHVPAQQLDTSWQHEFTEHVKSIDEFMKRFNGEEVYPGLEKTDGNFLKLNLFSLLDHQMNKDAKQNAIPFVSAIINNGVKLNYSDSLWYAEAKCNITYKGKPKTITLFLCPERIKDNKFRWAFCGADGINGNLIDTEHKSAISPVEHEIHFMELQSIFKNDRQHIFGYRQNDYKIDQLSVFLTLVYAGQINFISVSELKFHFFNVPDYRFIVEEIGRRGSNAGWLITSFDKLPQTDKNKYINNLIKK